MKQLNETYFQIWSANMAYILGYTFADGSVKTSTDTDKRYSVRWKCKDKDILEFIKSELQSEHKLTELVDQITGNTYWCFAVTRKNMVMDLMALGVIPRKTYGCVLPLIPEKYTRDFIRGYIDGDGSIYIRDDGKGKYLNSNMVAKTKEFLQIIGNIIRAFTGNIPKITPHEGSFRLAYGVSETLALCRWIYYSDQIFSLERKRDIFRSYLLSKGSRFALATCKTCKEEYTKLYDKSGVCFNCKNGRRYSPILLETVS